MAIDIDFRRDGLNPMRHTMIAHRRKIDLLRYFSSSFGFCWNIEPIYSRIGPHRKGFYWMCVCVFVWVCVLFRINCVAWISNASDFVYLFRVIGFLGFATLFFLPESSKLNCFFFSLLIYSMTLKVAFIVWCLACWFDDANIKPAATSINVQYAEPDYEARIEWIGISHMEWFTCGDEDILSTKWV